MRQFFTLDFRPFSPSGGRSLSWRKTSYFMIACFGLGVFAGGIFGFYSMPSVFPWLSEKEGAVDFVSRSYFDVLWSSGKYFLLLLIVSTSFLGVLLAPAVAMLRGYLLSFSISALFASYSWRGLLYAFISSGVTSLFAVPCFLIAACDAFFASRRLLDRSLGRGDPVFYSGPRAHLLLFTLLIFLDSLYTYFLLPVLIGRM